MQSIEPPVAVYELQGDGIREGYYCFAAQQTARSLLQTAGGPAEYAALPESRPVLPGTRVTFCSGGAKAPGCRIAAMDAAGRLNFFLPVSLRTATAEDLMLIPGVGAKTAQALIEYRSSSQHTAGAVLQDVPGLGEKKLQSLLPYLSTE